MYILLSIAVFGFMATIGLLMVIFARKIAAGGDEDYRLYVLGFDVFPVICRMFHKEKRLLGHSITLWAVRAVGIVFILVFVVVMIWDFFFFPYRH